MKRRKQNSSPQQMSEIGDLLNRSDDLAALHQLVDLCRNSELIHDWLYSEFARSKTAQASFRRLLSDDISPDQRSIGWPKAVYLEYVTEKRIRSQGGASYGGLKKQEVLMLIPQYLAPGMDPDMVLFVWFWLKKEGCAAPLMLREAGLLLGRSILDDSSGRRALCLAKTLCFFSGAYERGYSKEVLQHSSRWKLHLVFSMLEHPASAYRVSELLSWLPERFRNVDKKQIRLFCQKHGIRRIEIPGRPSNLD
jgi:hypothetical protein